MSRVVSRLMSHLSYANVMSTFAVFLLLGGGAAYAAATLPARSVGEEQLRNGAVTRSKIANNEVTLWKLAPQSVGTNRLIPGSVTRGRLSAGVRAQLDRAGIPGPVGPAGPVGPQGPGAARIAFDSAASPSAALATVLDIPGLRLQAACALEGGGVSMPLTITAAEESLAQESIAIDTGTDPASPAQTMTSNLQFELPAGVPVDTGGPQAGGDDYFRVIAALIASAPSRTITVNAAVMVNAATQRCSMVGTAVTATD